MNRHKPKLAPDLAKRAERLTATISALKVKVQKIFDEGEVAPKSCYVARYQVRQPHKIYWYYKLQGTEPIFEQATDRQKKSKYRHLGRAGSALAYHSCRPGGSTYSLLMNLSALLIL